jgi:hypothetical protein
MRAQRAGESALLLLDVIDALKAADVRYAVVGAMAASIHGVVRASLDADAVLALSNRELADLETSLRTSGLETELRYGDADDPIGAVLALTDSFGNRVDLLVGLRGLDPAAFTRAFDVPFQGERLRVVGREDFIAMKLFAHGPQDLADAEFALIAAGESVDFPLLERLAQRYGADTVAALRALQAKHSSQ